MTKTRKLESRVLVGVFVCTLLLFSVLPSAFADTRALTPAGSFRSEGAIYLDSEGRLLYHIKWDVSGISIKILDLDSLELRGEVKMPGSLESFVILATGCGHRGAGCHMPGGLAAVDSVRHRLFYPYRDPLTGQLLMAVIDGKTAELKSYPIPLPIAGSSQSTGIESIAYRPEDDTVFLLSITPLPTNAAAAIGNINLIALDGTSGAPKSHWSRTIVECSSLFPDSLAMPPLGISGDRLYLGCQAGPFSAGSALVLKMKVGPDGITDIRTFASPIVPRRGMFDPRSERIFLLNVKLLAAFDGVHETWFGLALSGGRPQIGFNAARGRVFLCGQSGWVVTDAGIAAPVPPPAAVGGANCKSDPSWPIVADARTGRVFAEVPRPEGVVNVDYWTAFEDPIPMYEAPPAFSPDEGAEDVEEEQGLTQSTFSAQGGAYGTRVIWVGGPLGTVDNTASFGGEVLRGDFGHRIGFRFAEGSRELRFANVPVAKMTDQGVEGSSIAIDRDSRLQTDFESLRQHQLNRAFRDYAEANNHPMDPEPSWPYSPALCVGYGGETDTRQDTSPDELAVVKCDYENKAFLGKAEADKHSVGSLLTIGESTATVRTYVDPVKGAMSESVALSRNINIGGLVTIGEARATSTAWARGRPGRADTSYERIFNNVLVKNQSGQTVYECGTKGKTFAQCDGQSITAAINTVLGPRIISRLPEPEQEFLNGTPKGTTASFRQNEWQQLEEQVLYDKPVEDLTMAAFELQIGANVISTSGYIIKLSGVTSSAGYRIFNLPQPIAFPDFDADDLVLGAADTTLGQAGSDEPKGPTTVMEKIVEKVRTGMRWLLGLQDGFRSVAATWAILVAPLYLIVRRRTMLRATLEVLSRRSS